MPPRIYKLSPLLRVICMATAANALLIFLKSYALFSGRWAIDPLSIACYFLTIFVMFALLRLNRIATTRISAIADTANDIVRTGDLSRRIPVRDEGTDVKSLAGILNRMLDEIELLMHGARTVSDNIAHDLRHPLTRLRNRLETLRDSLAGECPQAQPQLTELILECDTLLSTFQAILRISNIESARRHGGFREVKLNELLQDVADMYEPIAAEKHIALVIEGEPTRTIGDKDLLFQAFTNLLDNAVKYTPQGGNITIALMPHGQGGKVTLTDNGPGIPDPHKLSVFQRFYRIDPSRTEAGSGLGLSLVSAIVKLHQGSIILTDAQPIGLTVTVTL